MVIFPWALSLVVGFLSLSQEILWVRLGAFAYGGLPQIFSFILATYLIGIALGAYVGKLFCDRKYNLYYAGGATLLLAGVTDLLTTLYAPIILSKPLFLPLVALALILTAAIKSVLFPIAHHLGSFQSGPKIGRSVSKVYFANIIGSTLGPVVTGFFLLNHFTTEVCFLILGAGSLGMGAAMILKADPMRRSLVALGVVAAVLATLRPWNEIDALSKLADRQADQKPIAFMVQNKHGILHTLRTKDTGDVIIGGNMYDGHISTDMSTNANHLERAYVLAATHPAPRKVLVVGMSTGAWTRVALGFPGVEQVDVVEINPGYIDLIKRYPEVAPVLEDSRVHIYIDDARRWLKRNPDKKYDLIIQNTTFHWRANITNLLSFEYFKEMQKHMLPGAIAAINTTGSMDVFHTAQAAFPHAFRYTSFVYGSDHDIRVTPETAKDRLRQCRIGDAEAFLPAHFQDGGVAYKLAHEGVTPVAQSLAIPQAAPHLTITDQNVLTEYRHGKIVAPENLRWIWPVNPRADWKR